MDLESRSATSHQRPLDATIGLLANRQRRHALRYLARTDGATSLDAVVAHVCEQVNGDDRPTVRTTLHHVHLPRLADRGIVEYDPRRSRVRYLESPLVERLLAAVDPPETVPG